MGHKFSHLSTQGFNKRPIPVAKTKKQFTPKINKKEGDKIVTLFPTGYSAAYFWTWGTSKPRFTLNQRQKRKLKRHI